MKQATTIEEQLNLLRARGMVIDDEGYAKMCLEYFGYYRLGFYWYPFEDNRNEQNRSHDFIIGSKFWEVMELYHFDDSLRNLLYPYINNFEVGLRTKLVYVCSNYYAENPLWFCDVANVYPSYVEKFEKDYADISKNDVISRHHKKYPDDKYAPAWKTIEFMTFGGVVTLMKNLKNKNLQLKLAEAFGIRNLKVFFNYIDTIRILRNLCAHGRNIFDVSLQKSIKKGPLTYSLCEEDFHNLKGVILVLEYMLREIPYVEKHQLLPEIELLISKIQSLKNRELLTYLNFKI